MAKALLPTRRKSQHHSQAKKSACQCHFNSSMYRYCGEGNTTLWARQTTLTYAPPFVFVDAAFLARGRLALGGAGALPKALALICCQ